MNKIKFSHYIKQSYLLQKSKFPRCWNTDAIKIPRKVVASRSRTFLEISKQPLGVASNSHTKRKKLASVRKWCQCKVKIFLRVTVKCEISVKHCICKTISVQRVVSVSNFVSSSAVALVFYKHQLLQSKISKFKLIAFIEFKN